VGFAVVRLLNVCALATRYSVVLQMHTLHPERQCYKILIKNWSVKRHPCRLSERMTKPDAIPQLVNDLRSAYKAGTTRPLAWRRGQLQAMLKMLKENRTALDAALTKDLNRCTQQDRCMCGGVLCTHCGVIVMTPAAAKKNIATSTTTTSTEFAQHTATPACCLPPTDPPSRTHSTA
jgi:hypothetical protein